MKERHLRSKYKYTKKQYNLAHFLFSGAPCALFRIFVCLLISLLIIYHAHLAVWPVTAVKLHSFFGDVLSNFELPGLWIYYKVTYTVLLKSSLLWLHCLPMDILVFVFIRFAYLYCKSRVLNMLFMTFA